MGGRRPIKAMLHSVFTKLLLVLAAAGILINLLVTGFIASVFRNAPPPFLRDMGRYASYLADEIGAPPDMEKARRLSARSSLKIRYEESLGGEALSLPRQMHFIESQDDPRVRVGIGHHGRHTILVARGRGRFVFELSRPFLWESISPGQIAGLMLGLTGIIVVTWFLINRILRPIRWLTTGVREVSGGNLDHRVPEHEWDELGRLAAAFNTMTARIKEMLTARERLLLDASHELRSPLTRMNVALALMPDDKLKESLTADVGEMERMITEILEAARIKNTSARIHPSTVEIDEWLGEVIAEYDGRPPGVVIEPSADGPVKISWTMDRGLMTIVIRNLITNAVHHSADRPRPVRISSKISVAQEGECLEILVKDSGEGIPEEDLPHVFEPFYRADKSRSRKTGGFGLGLSIAKNMTEAHGGTIGVESKPGTGTTVTVRLPRYGREKPDISV